MLPCLGDPVGRAGGTLGCTGLCLPPFWGVLGVVSDLGWGHLCHWGMTGVRGLSEGGCPLPCRMFEFRTP